MKMVKNLTLANIKNIEGMIRREDLDFSDDGNKFRGFEYKGMPITTLRSEDITYLSIRWDYLDNEFTGNEWHKTEEYELCHKFNGVSEFDIDELVENLEKVIVKVKELNDRVKDEEIDTTVIEQVLLNEIDMVEDIIEDFKENFVWWEVEAYKLSVYRATMESLEQQISKAKQKDFNSLSRKEKKSLVEFYENYGYVEFKKDSIFLTRMKEAVK